MCDPLRAYKEAGQVMNLTGLFMPSRFCFGFMAALPA